MSCMAATTRRFQEVKKSLSLSKHYFQSRENIPGHFTSGAVVYGSRIVLPTCDVLSHCSRPTQALRASYGNFRNESIKTKCRLQDMNTSAVALRRRFLINDGETAIDLQE